MFPSSLAEYVEQMNMITVNILVLRNIALSAFLEKAMVMQTKKSSCSSKYQNTLCTNTMYWVSPLRYGLSKKRHGASNLITIQFPLPKYFPMFLLPHLKSIPARSKFKHSKFDWISKLCADLNFKKPSLNCTQRRRKCEGSPLNVTNDGTVPIREGNQPSGWYPRDKSCSCHHRSPRTKILSANIIT